jgi:hypothetical protein
LELSRSLCPNNGDRLPLNKKLKELNLFENYMAEKIPL